MENLPSKITPLDFAITLSETGLIQQIDLNRNVSETVNAYSSKEYNFITKPPGTSDWATSIGEKYKDFILECIPNLQDLDILEVGGGNEYFGVYAVNEGAKSYTIIDPAITYESKNNKLRVIKDYFTNKTSLDKQFNLIISLNTIEHVPCPKSFMNGIFHNLKSNGYLILVYPNIENQFENGDFNSLLHEHISYFTTESSIALFRSTGFYPEVIKSSEDTFYIFLRKETPIHNNIFESQSDFFIKSKSVFEKKNLVNLQKK